MKIVEALKTMKLLEKRIKRVAEEITQYAAGVSHEPPPLGSAKEQASHVASLLQSGKDLVHEYESLTQRLHRTNLDTTVNYGGVECTIAELLIERRKTGAAFLLLLAAQKPDAAVERAERLARAQALPEGAHIVLYYDDKRRLDGIRHLRDRVEGIDGFLEVVNATTDLVE